MLLRHPVLSLVTLAYLAFVGWLTLGPQPLDDGTNGFVFWALERFESVPALAWIDYNDLEFAANVFMFLPIGLFLVLLFGRRLWWLAILIGMTLTLGIETVQLVLPERVSDVRDLVSNGIGTVVGVVLALVLTAPQARRLRNERLTSNALSSTAS